MSNHHAFPYFGTTTSAEGDHRPTLTSSISSPSIFSSPHYQSTADGQLLHQPYDDPDRPYDGHQPLQIDVSYTPHPHFHDPHAAPGSATEQFYGVDDTSSGNMEQQQYHQQQQSQHFLAPSSSTSSSRHGEESSSSSTGNLGGMGRGGSGSLGPVPAGMPGQDVTQPTSISASTSSGDRTSVGSSRMSKSLSRARVNMACSNCRSRKIRCDGEQPSCSTCKRLNRPCNYESISEEENLLVRERKRKSRELKQARLKALSGISVGAVPHGRRQYDQPPHSAHFTGSMMPPSANKLMDMHGRRHSASSSLTQFGGYPTQQQQLYQYPGAPGPSVLREGRGGGIGERPSPYPLMPLHRQPMYTNSAAPPPLPSPALSQSTSSPVQTHYPQAPFHPQGPHPSPSTQRAWQSQMPPSSPVTARYGNASLHSARRRADTVGGHDDYGGRGPHDQVLAWRGQLSSSSGDALLHGDLAAVSGNTAAYETIPAHAVTQYAATGPPAMMGMSQPVTPESSYHLQGQPHMLAYEYNSNGGGAGAHGGGGSADHSPGNPDLQFWRWSGSGGPQQPPSS